jgi:hypothetical protein
MSSAAFVLSALGALWALVQILRFVYEPVKPDAVGETVAVPKKRLRLGLVVLSVVLLSSLFGIWRSFVTDATTKPEGDPHYLYMTYWGPSQMRDGMPYLEVDTQGKYFASKASNYKLAAVAVRVGTKDPLDTEGLQKSALYEIVPEEIKILIPVDTAFVESTLHKSKGTNYQLLLVPRGMTMDQFLTLGQAESAGIKLVQHLASAP